MGLDSNAYAVPAGTTYNPETETAENIQYWRKNNALHGWMERLYRTNGGTEMFNCVPLQLTAENLKQLRKDIKANELTPTEGFFFGEQSYTQNQKKEDLAFVKLALMCIEKGNDIYYNSWW